MKKLIILLSLVFAGCISAADIENNSKQVLMKKAYNRTLLENAKFNAKMWGLSHAIKAPTITCGYTEDKKIHCDLINKGKKYPLVCKGKYLSLQTRCTLR